MIKNTTKSIDLFKLKLSLNKKNNKDNMMTTQHPKLFDLVRQRIRYKHMSYRTEQAYCGWIKRYVIFHQMRHPQEMGRLEVESYLSHLVNVGNVSQSTHHQALSALLFLYKEVLGVGLPWLLELNRPNKPKRLPVALTHLEVQSVFKHLSGIHLLMAKMLYGTGMRLTELLQLRIKDIDLSIGSIKHLFTPKLKYHTRNCCSFLLPKPQNLASQRLKQVVFWSI